MNSSTVVWIFFTLLAVDALLLLFRPLQYVTGLSFIPRDQHPLVAKLPVYLASREHTNLLILGSSLPMCAIGLYDGKCFGEPDLDETFGLRRYLGARYLEQELSRKYGHSIKAVNLTIISCMISDIYIILENSIGARKKPDRVLLCLAPRDFVDNTVRSIGQTPAFEHLQDWKSLKEVFQSGASISERRDLLVARLWYYYRVKVDYRTMITQNCANFLHRPLSLYLGSQAVAGSKQADRITSPQQPIGDNYDLLYAQRYKPPNFRRFELEKEYFEKLLALCLNEKIQCIVVNMPVSASHQAILDAKLNRLYIEEGKKLCEKYGALYFDFNDQEFLNKDFSDGFHLNDTGSEKFQKRLVRSLVSQSAFMTPTQGY